MKKPILFLSFALLSFFAFAQTKPVASNPKNVVFKTGKFELGQLVCKVVDAQVHDSLLTLKLNLVNNTDSFYLFKTNECGVVIGDNRLRVELGELTINPQDSVPFTLDFKAAGLYKEKGLSFYAEGFYMVAPTGDVQTPPIFNLPPDYKDFTSPSFTGIMTKDSRTTDLTEIEFKVTYTGDKVGIISPVKTLLRLTDGLLVNNMAEQSKAFLLTKGYSQLLKLHWPKTPEMQTDMQGNHLELLFRDTFIESMPNRIATQKFLLEVAEPVIDTTKSKK